MGLTLEECGVVGAGGGGFPTEAKLQTPVPLVIVNGAECEPLLHKDKELLRHEAAAMLAGLATVMDRVGASEAVVGVKNKYEDVIRALQPMLPAGVRTFALSRQLPGRRRVRPRARRDRARHPPGRPSARRRRARRERRDARERRPRPAGDAQVPDRGRRGAGARDAARPGRHVDRRGDRGGRRHDGAERGRPARRRDDGAARRVARRARDEDDGRRRRAPGHAPAGAPALRDAGRRCSGSAAPRATSAASARSCARATSSATRSSRTGPCRRSASSARRAR